MFGEIWGRLAGSPGTFGKSIFATAIMWMLDLAGAAYVSLAFKRFGEAGYASGILVLTGFLLAFGLFRFLLSDLRQALLALAFASGPEGDIALLRACAAGSPAQRSARMNVARMVSGAFSAGSVAALLDLPFAVLFLAPIFVVAGTATGTACSAVVALAVVVLLLASARSRRLNRDLVAAEGRLAKAQDEAEAAALAVDAHARRMHAERAAGTDRGIGLLFSTLMLGAAIASGPLLGDALAIPQNLIVANILAARSVGAVIQAIGAMSRMAAAMPAKQALDAELSA
ncbi:protein of unknown function (putative ATP-binding cassette subfamily) (plasmid) [Magnetospirillum sp. XM-1]|uniref:hypothetical protein n=1 Tax=unclassified Magnetospirillum TaxID=2617991 RepID=UPI00073DDE73|nr:MULTISPECIES: hypothetical protein [unclassified Magnetospirillum]ARJ66033.1 hypothetical protein WV31_10380 [Magnetospirillum sp. ME-1]CUW41970.1 protein of unknown function (putative ATP-binding cassette subfamily) [Magnetospirillum sp. XM-1]